MPWVSFTDHAVTRCKQQHIPLPVVRKAVITIPLTAGELKWYFPNRFSVVVHCDPEQEKFIVITVIGVKRMERKKNRGRISR